MWPRTLMRFGGVFLGVIIGLGVAGIMIAWTNDGYYMRQQPLIYDNRPIDGFRVETTVSSGPVKKTMVQEKHVVKETEKRTLAESKSLDNLYKAYGHVHTVLFFIGYPRSRHSLLGSLLDAHPHMVISDETFAFMRWRGNLKKRKNGTIYQFYDSMFGASQRAVSQGRRSRVFEGSVVNKTSSYGYYVPNQWQGTYDQYVEVIGDKSGAFTAKAMRQRDALDAVRLLEQASGAKVKFVHVVRNPFDNIATMALQDARIKKRDGTHDKKQVNVPKVVDESILRYFSWAEGSNKAREALPGSVLDIPSMEVVKNPAGTLRKICTFLEIWCSEQYIQDCAATVDPVPSITRDFITWTAEQKKRVYEEMKKYSFFKGYSYDR
ncbi:uncharacterized protein LOC144628030 isoform X1 [Oculina patagonica]